MFKDKFSKIVVSLVLVSNLLGLSLMLPPPAYAACSTSATPPQTKITKDKDGKVIKKETIPGKVASNDEISNCLKNNKIVADLNKIVNFLSAGVGIVVTGSIIFAGIQYSLAGGDSAKVSAAKKRITDSLIALLAFAFMYAFLQWIIPGGVFG
jgi:hypothetical protein